MKGKGLLIKATFVLVVAIMIFIVNLSYGNVEVGASVLLPDGSESVDSSYVPMELRSTTTVDSYGVRFGDVNYYSDLNQISVTVFGAKGTDDEEYSIRVYDFLSQKELGVIRTGAKSKLYHTYENIYTYLDEDYSGTLMIEVIKGEKVMERISIRIY